MIGQKNYGARMSNSIAKNHLSSLAQKGRHGDDRILQFSDGRVEHGNAFEEKLMGDALGESLVDAIGSKTINPETGLRENWVTAALTGLSVLLGGVSSYGAGSAQQDAAEARLRESRAGLLDIEESEARLSEAVASQRQLVGQKFGKEIEDFSTKTGIEKGQIIESFSRTAGKTGLAYSGESEAGKERSLDIIQEKASSYKEGMLGEYGRSLGDIAANYEQSKARLKAERQKFEREISLSEQAADKWYLGKNIRGWGDPDKFWS